MNTVSHGASLARRVQAHAMAGLLLLSLTLGMAAASAKGRADILWSAAGHAEGVTALDLSPDGGVLATASEDATLKLWRYPDGTLLRTLVLPYDIASQSTGVAMARFTPDGAYVAAAWGRYDGGTQQSFATVDVFRVGDGKLVREFGRQNGGIASVDVSPDGAWVASAGQSGALMIWRLADGKLVKTLAQHPGPATDVHFSPAGDRLIAAFGDFHLVSWKTSDWSVQWDVPAHADVIERIAVSTDGARVATASADGSAKLFDTADGALLFTLPVGGGVFATAFSPDGQGLVTGGTDGTIRLWSVAGGTLVRRFTDSGGWILSLRYAGEGAAVISGGEFPSRIKEWNPMSGTPIQALTRLSAPIGKVTFSPDSALIAVAATFDERVDLYRASNGRRLYSWNLHSDVLDVAFSPDGRLVAMPGPGNTVVVRRLADGRVMHKLVGHQENVVGVAFSHDGTLLASGSFFPGSIRLWRTSDWTLVREIEGGSDLGAFGPFESFSFSPDDKLLGAVGEGSPIVVRVSDGSVVAAPASVTRAATFSPDGQLFVLSGGDNFDAVRIYRTSDWTLAHSLATGANDIAFSSDGKSLLVAHLDALRIWRTSDWTAVETYDRELGYTGDGQGVQAVAFAPDGSRLAYGRYDATLVTATNPRADMPR